MRSQNGWSADPHLALRPFVVGDISFLPGIRDDDDVEAVLRHVLTAFHERVEPLVNPGCWGFSYRENRNDPNSLSNHSSGTAVDANAPQHPNGVATFHTFTSDQINEVHKILAEVSHIVRWGGDYTGTPDAMHFEINTDPATLHEVAQRIGDDMPLNADDLTKIRIIVREEAVDAVDKALDAELNINAPDGDVRFRGWSVRRALKALLTKTGAVK